MTSATRDRDWVVFFPDFRVIDETLWHLGDEEYEPVDDSMIRNRLCREFGLHPVEDATFLEAGVDAVCVILRVHEELAQDFASELEGKFAVGYCLGVRIMYRDGHRFWTGWVDDGQLEKLGLSAWGQKRVAAAWHRYLRKAGPEEGGL